MKITTWNINGIRASFKKGFWQNLPQSDIFCLQEIKADQLTMQGLYQKYQSEVFENNFEWSWLSAQKKGYSGVMIGLSSDFANKKLKSYSWDKGLGIDKFDFEGRVLTLKMELNCGQKIAIVNAYYPQGGRGQERIEYKLEFYLEIKNMGLKLRKQGFKLIFTGDFNTTVWDIDIARAKENRKTTGCLPEERLVLGYLLKYPAEVLSWYQSKNMLDTNYQASPNFYSQLPKPSEQDLNLVDGFRYFYPDLKDKYTYWDQITRARERNVGWRIDYLLFDSALLPSLKSVDIKDKVMGSDHCPVIAKIED